MTTDPVSTVSCIAVSPHLWSVEAGIGALLGLGLHLSMSWQEWQKVAKIRVSFWCFLSNDAPAASTAMLLALFAYFALPALGSITWWQTTFGFLPGQSVPAAAATSFIFSTIGYKLRNIVRKRVGPDDSGDAP